MLPNGKFGDSILDARILDARIFPTTFCRGLEAFLVLVKQNEKPRPEKAELVGKV
jgi:hypothetical protein